jgi:hypothetical protein
MVSVIVVLGQLRDEMSNLARDNNDVGFNGRYDRTAKRYVVDPQQGIIMMIILVIIVVNEFSLIVELENKCERKSNRLDFATETCVRQSMQWQCLSKQ